MPTYCAEEGEPGNSAFLSDGVKGHNAYLLHGGGSLAGAGNTCTLSNCKCTTEGVAIICY